MSAKSSPYNNGGNDTLMIVGGALLLVFVLLLIVWFNFHPFISLIVIKIAYVTLPILEAIHSWSASIGLPESYLNIVIPQHVIDDLPNYKYWLPRTDPKTVDFKTFVSFAELTGYSVRLFLPLISILCIVYVWKRSKAARLSRVMNIFTLAKFTMSQFPQIRPAIIEDLLKIDPDKGYFRREDSPIRFAIKNGLIQVYLADFKGQLLPTKVTPTFDKSKSRKEGMEYVIDDYSRGISKLHNRCILDRTKTERLFISQLGKPWTGSTDLAPFTRALYSAFIAFAAGSKDEAFALLDQFNRSWKPPKKKNSSAEIDITGIDKTIEKYEKLPEIKELISSHAYVNTVMARLLEAARTKGRLGTPLFLWIKVVDRVLWYSLNQEGGQCGWSEAAGARAHKIAEKSVGGPLHQPYVETAVSEFEEYLQFREGWIPLPEDLPKTPKEDN
ncbi:secretion/conjugation apparatus DotM-related subunit [Teredinibacter purpureus]|uniref:secretion/conjugation apparatus DotM-related subunit n=1 Tax=Teredinibacter purpureus TaxID=2731756 RepID=UPI0005F76E8F|nr:hypothetical protein [Teredinibacter purpureus]